jgi:hypothetical protein
VVVRPWDVPGAVTADPWRAAADPVAPAPAGRRIEAALLVGAAVAGVVLRLQRIASPAGTIDSDVATIGLMARHVRLGELPVFHWGQAYGGSHEAVLAGVVFLVTGASAVALQVVTVALSLLAAVLLHAVARPALGPRAAAVATAAYLVWPAPFVWWSVKPGSDYWFTTCACLAATLVLQRLAAGEARRPAAAFAGFGVLAGLAWWGHPQAVAVLAPVGLWHLRTFLARPVGLALALGGAVVGAAPWLGYNLRHGWPSLDLPPAEAGYLTRLHDLVEVAGPMALGLRVPYTREWLVPSWSYWVLLAVLIGAGLVGARSRLPVAVFLAMPPLVAVSPLSSYVDQPRYLVFVAPFAAMLVGVALTRAPRWAPAAGLAALLALTVVGLGRLDRDGVAAPYAPDVHVPEDLSDLQALVDDLGVEHAHADYWLAYRFTFETEEDVLVSPLYVTRRREIDAAVRADPAAAYLFVRTSWTYAAFADWCRAAAAPCRVEERGDVAVVVPGRPVVPEEVPIDWSAVTG